MGMTENALTKIGKANILNATWKEVGKDKKLFLQAVGPGDVSFAAYAPGTENVFSFIDTMQVNPTDKSSDAKIIPDDTVLTYMVFGWYSNDKFDPLSGLDKNNIKQYLDNLLWSIPNQDAILNDISSGKMMVPSISYYHGVLHSVKWQTKFVPQGDDTAIPQDIADNINVAIGSTAIEALAAMLQYKAGASIVDTKLLEAFQYGVIESIEEPGGEELLNNKVRQARYGSSNGGTLWEIVPITSDDGSVPDTIDLTPYNAYLVNLNLQQKTLDEKLRLLNSYQSTLYFYWWKNKSINITGGPANQPEDWDSIVNDLNQTSTKFTTLISTINQLRKDIADITSTIPGAKDDYAIAKYSKETLKLPDTLQLKPKGNARFWFPNDPVILVTGLGKNFSDDPDQLICRLSTQLISGLEVKGNAVKDSEIMQFISMPLQNSDVSDLLQLLSIELYFLDPNNLANMARDAYKGSVLPQDISDAIKAGKFIDKKS